MDVVSENVFRWGAFRLVEVAVRIALECLKEAPFDHHGR